MPVDSIHSDKIMESRHEHGGTLIDANGIPDSDDAAAMEAIGKKPEFERRFNFWTALAITICISGTVSLPFAQIDPEGSPSPFFKQFENLLLYMSVTNNNAIQWEGISAVLVQAITLGGPVGLLYGYIITAACMTCVAASLAELGRQVDTE